MAEKPSFSDKIELEAHYKAIEEITKRYGITPKGVVATQYPYDDDHIVVEGDGFGGGDLMRVCDQYPFDGFMQHNHHHFDDEDEACKAAEWFDQHQENGGEMTATEFFDAIAEGKKPWEEEEADESATPESTGSPTN